MIESRNRCVLPKQPNYMYVCEKVSLKDDFVDIKCYFIFSLAFKKIMLTEFV
jgi:hypothetical protein